MTIVRTTALHSATSKATHLQILNKNDTFSISVCGFFTKCYVCNVIGSRREAIAHVLSALCLVKQLECNLKQQHKPLLLVIFVVCTVLIAWSQHHSGAVAVCARFFSLRSLCFVPTPQAGYVL